MNGVLSPSSAMAQPIDEEELQDLYTWIDEVPLSRPKRNLGRDFSDGVLVAEVVRHFYPRYVELHNYTPANSASQKLENWKTLNRKVFKRLNFEVSDEIIRQITLCKQYVIERVLMMLRQKILNHTVSRGDSSGSHAGNDQRHEARYDKPEADQNPHMMGSPGRFHPNGAESKPPRGKKPVQPTVQFSDPNSPGRPPPGGRVTKPVNHSPQKVINNSRVPGMSKASSLSNISNNKKETVPVALYEENMAHLERKEQECLAKEETIQILQAKIRRLEQLVHLKDIRIEELQASAKPKR